MYLESLQQQQQQQQQSMPANGNGKEKEKGSEDTIKAKADLHEELKSREKGGKVPNEPTTKRSVKRSKIRIDPYTGDRYVRTIPLMATNGPSGAFDTNSYCYEKEVYSSNVNNTIFKKKNKLHKKKIIIPSQSLACTKKPMTIAPLDEESLTLNRGVTVETSLVSTRDESKSERKLTAMTMKRARSWSDDQMMGYSWLGKSMGWTDYVKQAASNVWHYQVIALVLLSLIITGIAYAMSMITETSWWLTNQVYQHSTWNTYIRLFGVIIIRTLFVLVSIFLALHFAPQCIGSGIPELKAILSGIWIRS
ncbi:hypothetical protein RFI_14518 [Reticulomyxa filosa]|uniref:Uncharacterized protein n=1 Tax=Reticulomyxa filosa TaxID=46433 RepID=X6NBI0_RETFI|nr:hypothetical protein RFI_14518 [Reticulomyxa filosa]|eukprot:ETO22677.1 hypothetical protein RFI_14518 [Reticulomyxa filosa]